MRVWLLMSAFWLGVLLAAASVAAGDPLEEARVLNQQVIKLYKAGRYQEAVPLAQQALKIREKVLGPEHPDTAHSLNNLAMTYHQLGAYEKALPLLQRALEIKEKTFGPDHPETAYSINQLAMTYDQLGAYEQALPLLQRALEIEEKTLGPDHPTTAHSLNNLAGLYRTMGAYGKALPLYQRALQIYEKAQGPEHPDTARSLNNLAVLYKAMGAYDQALPLYQRGLQIDKKTFGPDHLTTAHSLNNLAELYRTMGAYDQALLLFQQALKIFETAQGPEHSNTAISLNNLAVLYANMGLYDQALPLFQQALMVEEKASGPDHSKTATRLNNLAEQLDRLGASDQALPMLQRALRIREKALGPEHPDTISTITNLGLFYLSRRENDVAATYLQRSKSKAGLTELALVQGRPGDAIQLLQGRKPTWRSTPGYKVEYYTQQGQALSGLSRRPEAVQALLRAVQGVEELRKRVSMDKAGFFRTGMPGGYLRPYRELVEVLAEITLEKEELPQTLREYGPDPGAAAFYFAEATKARVLLEAMAQSARQQTRLEIPEELRQKEASLLNQMAALELQWEKAFTGGETALQEVQEKKARLTGELKALIQELRQKYPLYAALHYPEPLPARDLPLQENEVLLEYALGDKVSTIFVVRKGGVAKLLKIPLGREGLETKVKAFMAPFLNADPEGFSPTRAQELYELLLAGVLPEIKETDRLIIVSDGILGLLPFEALVVQKGKGIQDSVYVGDRYTLSYYQSATVLALQRRLQEHRATRPLLALGHPVFSPQDARVLASPQGTTPPRQPAQAAVRGAFRALASHRDWGKTRQGDPAATELAYAPLPETEAEVKGIAQLLGVAVQPPDVLLNLAANETTLRQSPLGEYRFLHFATHADLSNKVQGINEPFILLGQVGNEGPDDGFLTLSEVLGLKLKADLVVLSACQTGRGTVMEGEGVANFARSFQHAGAKSVLVSLWPVASDEAVELMTMFYGYLQKGKLRAEALRLARQTTKAKYPQPFFWAVFILHGEG
jgi:CHAT domain-containing protein/Tfp pilus assembly protein PilF